jgi:hypothetical protein
MRAALPPARAPARALAWALVLAALCQPAASPAQALPPLQVPGASPINPQAAISPVAPTAPTAPAAPAAPGAPAAPAGPAWVARNTADLVALDRITAKSLTLTLTIGQVARVHTLSIALRACDVRPPDQAPDATAFLDITDSNPGAAEFHGWLIRSAPAVSNLQSPLYDVELLGCR